MGIRLEYKVACRWLPAASVSADAVHQYELGLLRKRADRLQEDSLCRCLVTVCLCLRSLVCGIPVTRTHARGFPRPSAVLRRLGCWSLLPLACSPSHARCLVHFLLIGFDSVMCWHVGRPLCQHPGLKIADIRPMHASESCTQILLLIWSRLLVFQDGWSGVVLSGNLSSLLTQACLSQDMRYIIYDNACAVQRMISARL